MVAAINHRGPDSRGWHVEQRVALGAARLAIIDLHGGDQPIYNEDRSLACVYNGEVYNYRQIRSDLLARGHHLRSETDSETIVHLYEEDGIDLVRRLNGMFGFALWDSRRETLWLARDRYGIKPIYYSFDGRALAFGSEVKCLLAAGRVKAELDLGAFTELFTFQNILSSTSLFKGVELVPAGHVLRLDRDGIELIPYWDALPEPAPVSRDDAIAGVRERFEGGVLAQLVSDVEVASYLSGGLDTGAIAAAAAGGLDRLTTFATGFDVSEATGREAGFDERGDAADLASHIGSHHHELLLDHHDLDMVLPRLVRHLEEPRMSFSYPNYLTAGFASRWVKVVLSGAGGDELFGGYPWRYEFAGKPGFEDAYFDYWQRLMPRGELSEAVSADLDLDRPRDVYDEIMGRADGLSDIDRTLYFESKTFLHGLLIVEDKLSMAHSLESRVPFLDNDLVDYVLTLPADVKLHSGRSKDLFRRAMTVLLPEEVISRRKTGFTPPQEAWFRGEQAGYVERTLLSEAACDRGLFRVDFVRDVLNDHRAGRADRRLLLWTMLCLEWWHRIFVDGEHTT